MIQIYIDINTIQYVICIEYGKFLVISVSRLRDDPSASPQSTVIERVRDSHCKIAENHCAAREPPPEPVVFLTESRGLRGVGLGAGCRESVVLPRDPYESPIGGSVDWGCVPLPGRDALHTSCTHCLHSRICRLSSISLRNPGCGIAATPGWSVQLSLLPPTRGISVLPCRQEGTDL